MTQRFLPHVTVAAVIEENNRFLLVEEQTDQGIAYNQPAGHLEEGESLLAAVVREVREETARAFTPQHLLGVYRWRNPLSGLSFVRFTFIGAVGERNLTQSLDEGIIDTHWLSVADIASHQLPLRSVMVDWAMRDYAAGRRYPLALLADEIDLCA